MATTKVASEIGNLCKSLGRLSVFTSTAAVRSTSALLRRRSMLVCPVSAHSVHMSAPRYDLMEFFDKKANWGESSVKVGRPWKLDELRLKSNSDLHKLWYVLLKERNMLMTMEEEYRSQSELFPSPERLEKVEESMENLLDVVSERNRAHNLLETGETGEPGRRWAYNQLGIGFWRKCKEQHMPLHANPKLRSINSLSGPWQHKYLRLMREKRLKLRSRSMVREKKRYEVYSQMFPNADFEPDLERFKKTLASSMKGPSN